MPQRNNTIQRRNRGSRQNRQKSNKKGRNVLKFIALSGTTHVTSNLYIYEYGDDMIIVDCGVGFPEPEMYGVDLTIPDFTYIRQNQHKIRAMLVTHGHEDHMGAIPFLAKDLEVDLPIHTAPLTAGFIEDKFRDHGIKPNLHVFDPENATLDLGVFKVTPFRISHSVPDAVGYAIDTPEGRVFHLGESKLDWTPVDGKPFALKKVALLLAEGQPLALAGDCLGSTHEGHTHSEREIEKRIEYIAREATGQIFFTTISSNISRMQQAINVAKRLKKTVMFVGRSVDTKAHIARDLGYLKFDDADIFYPKKNNRAPRTKNVMYIISGCYGQPGSALSRVAHEDHRFLSLEPGDTVVFSADPGPPGSKATIDALVDTVIDLGAHVHYYDMQEDLHVSGHGSIEDIKTFIGLFKPQYYLPIGGTIRNMKAYKDIAVAMGAQEQTVFELRAGDSVEFENQNARKGQHIDVHTVLVDGMEIGGVGTSVLRDRKMLATEGILVALVHIDASSGKIMQTPDLINRGFVFEKENIDLLKNAARLLETELSQKKKLDRGIVKETTHRTLERYFSDQVGRYPMIVPVTIDM